MFTIEDARSVAEEAFGTELYPNVTQFDLEQAQSVVYDILGITTGCDTDDVLRKAIVFHMINEHENNPEKDSKRLKADLGSYLRAHGKYPSVRY